MRYWLKKGDNLVGPLESRELFNVPSISLTSKICLEPELGKWRELASVPELTHLMELRETCSLVAGQARGHEMERQRFQKEAEESLKRLRTELEPLQARLRRADEEKERLALSLKSLAETCRGLARS